MTASLNLAAISTGSVSLDVRPHAGNGGNIRTRPLGVPAIEPGCDVVCGCSYKEGTGDDVCDPDMNNTV